MARPTTTTTAEPLSSDAGSDPEPAQDTDPDFVMAGTDGDAAEPRVEFQHRVPDDAAPDPASDKIDRDAFAEMFIGAFEVPAMLKGPRYAALKVDQDRRGPATVTAHLLHEWALKYAPWMLPSGTGDIGRYLVAFAFCKTQYVIYADIRRQERAEAETAETKPAAEDLPGFDGTTGQGDGPAS